MPLAVVAVGGNSLAQAGQAGTIDEQFANARITARHLSALIKRGWQIVITHGNGPQVGNMLLRVELSLHQVYPLPLDICVADSQGGIGYMLQQVLGNELRTQGLAKTVVTLINQVLVDALDPGFKTPDKPVGRFFEADEARQKIAQGWQMREDAGRGFRRVVASPKPQKILELQAVRAALEAGFIPIAVGGGGIPVVQKNGEITGIEAVIDKDRASALLARELKADLFLISTAVPVVQLNFGKTNAELLNKVTGAEMRDYWQAGQFPAGSMGPKIEAALDYLEHGGKEVIITDPPNLEKAVFGEAGTHIVS